MANSTSEIIKLSEVVRRYMRAVILREHIPPFSYDLQDHELKLGNDVKKIVKARKRKDNKRPETSGALRLSLHYGGNPPTEEEVLRLRKLAMEAVEEASKLFGKHAVYCTGMLRASHLADCGCKDVPRYGEINGE